MGTGMGTPEENGWRYHPLPDSGTVYDVSHEHRLRRVRALIAVGGPSVQATVGEVLGAVDDLGQPLHDVRARWRL